MYATETYALAGCLALGTLCLLHARVWHAEGARWSLCLSLAYGLIGLGYAFDPQLQPLAGRPNPIAVTVAASAALLSTIGLAQYFALPQAMARRIGLGTGLVCAALVLLVFAGMLPRLAGFALLSSIFTMQALMALYAMRREPDSGHGLVALGLLLYPALWLAAAADVLPLQTLRYAFIVPHAVTGATVLTTGLLRAQRRARDELQRREATEQELQALNASLEQRVAQRTAELHEVISGLESFNRSVSHDLRGPLGGIAGVARLAREALDRRDVAGAQRMLDVIATQAESSAKLVNALLALARVGDVPLRPQPVDLDAFVRDTLEQMRQTQPAEPAPPVQVQGALPPVQADPDLLRQVLVNLLSNALKFSRDQAAPQIEVGALPRDAAHPHEQVIFVRDNGVGFDARDASELFEPFHRLHDAKRFQGNGVGLSIVKRIVERHGGKVWAESSPQAGSTFYFSLPA